MSLIRLNQLHTEIMAKVDEKDVAIKRSIETSMQYTVGPVAPASPSVGYRWFDTANSLMKVWNGTGLGADWEITNANAIYLPGRNAIDSMSTAMKQITTGSGFVEFGGRIASNKTVNRAMLANQGNPRLAGIVGTGETAIKKFWFENFFLLNANGYSEETLLPSTGEITQVLVNGIGISLQGTLPNSSVITSKHLMAVNLPTAPGAVTELNRNEIVFLEVWREKITDTGYVFPYGNVQYTADSADGIATTYFNGEIGYCASYTGDNVTVTEINQQGTEVTTTKPKGRGWVWKDLQAAYKNTIASNYKHNIFVDGDDLVQIRYRVRVSKFSSLPAVPLTHTTFLGYTADNDATTTIRAQGKMGTLNTSDVNYRILAPFNQDNPHALKGTYSTEYTTDLSHDGFVFALPMAVVSRRNSGVFDTIFNPNGSARFRDGLRLVADYDSTDDIIGFALMDKENATLASSTTGSTWSAKYDIMMKWLFDRTTVLTAYDNAKGFVIGGDMNSGISGRYDALFYDEVNEVDVNDLRMDVNKQLDLKYILEKEFNKFILGDQRGWGQENHLRYWSGDLGKNANVITVDAQGVRTLVKDAQGVQVKGYGYVTELPIYYKLASGTTIDGIDADIATKITEGYTSTLLVRSGRAPVTTEEKNLRSGYSNKFVKRVQVSLAPVLNAQGQTQRDVNNALIQKIVIHDGEAYVDEKTQIIIVSPKGRAARKTQLHADIIGDPAGNSFKYSTTMKVSEIPADAVLENGNIVFTGQNYYVYMGSRKSKAQIESSHTDTSGNFKIDVANTNDWIDVTGKGGYSEGWRMYGNLGSSLLVDESGVSLIPRDVLSGLNELVNGTMTRTRKNTKFFKLSKPTSTIKKVIVTTDRRAGKKAFLTQITATKDVNGTTQSILDQVDSTPGTFGYDNALFLTNSNTVAINWATYTDDAIIEIYYETESNPTTITTSTRVEMLGDVWLGNSLYHRLGCKAISNMISKVATYDAPQGSRGAAKRIPLATYLVNKGDQGAVLNANWSIITHAPVGLAGSGPAVKVLPYVTSVNGEMYLKLLYKELDPTVNGQNVAYTLDNSEFVVVDGETTDNNGGLATRVKIGQRKIKLPYYFGDVI